MKKLPLGVAFSLAVTILTGCGGLSDEQLPLATEDEQVASTEQAVTYNDYNYVCARDLSLRYSPGGDSFFTLVAGDVVYVYYPPSGAYADVRVAAARYCPAGSRGWALKDYISRSC